MAARGPRVGLLLGGVINPAKGAFLRIDGRILLQDEVEKRLPWVSLSPADDEKGQSTKAASVGVWGENWELEELELGDGDEGSCRGEVGEDWWTAVELIAFVFE